MGGIGIVNNPRSSRNRRHPATGARLAALLGADGEVRDAATPQELDRALRAFRDAGGGVLGVNGGDGTCHVVVTAAARAWGGAPLPLLLVLPGGTMNTLAANHGLRGPPERILRDALARRRAGLPLATVERDLLRVEADVAPAVLGFFFATGAAVTFLERYYAARRPSPASAWWLVARAAASALVGGRLARSLSRREPLRVEADGDEWPDAGFLGVAAGTVPSPGLGFRPLARCDEQPGAFHLVGVHGTLPQVLRQLPRMRRGAPWRRRAALDAVVRRAAVAGEAVRFTVDGDLYDPARRILLSTGPAVRIVVPSPRAGRFDRAGGGD
jgi:diacylglycerol kinase family enzyme